MLLQELPHSVGLLSSFFYHPNFMHSTLSLLSLFLQQAGDDFDSSDQSFGSSNLGFHDYHPFLHHLNLSRHQHRSSTSSHCFQGRCLCDYRAPPRWPRNRRERVQRFRIAGLQLWANPPKACCETWVLLKQSSIMLELRGCCHFFTFVREGVYPHSPPKLPLKKDFLYQWATTRSSWHLNWSRTRD